MFKISLEEADKMVENDPTLSWDGWTIVYTKPYKMGWARKDGVWSTDIRGWATVKRYEVHSDGLYHIPKAMYDGLQHSMVE